MAKVNIWTSSKNHFGADKIFEGGLPRSQFWTPGKIYVCWRPI